MQLTQLTMQFTWRDGLEIGVVALVFYRILRLIHGTRALQILGGVAVLVAAFSATVAVWGKASNGWQRIGYDAHLNIAFALAQRGT